MLLGITTVRNSHYCRFIVNDISDLISKQYVDQVVASAGKECKIEFFHSGGQYLSPLQDDKIQVEMNL